MSYLWEHKCLTVKTKRLWLGSSTESVCDQWQTQHKASQMAGGQQHSFQFQNIYESIFYYFFLYFFTYPIRQGSQIKAFCSPGQGSITVGFSCILSLEFNTVKLLIYTFLFLHKPKNYVFGLYCYNFWADKYLHHVTWCH